MSFHLMVIHGPRQGLAIPLKRSSFLIGRGAQCHLRPASPAVGDCHCVLFTRDGKLFVRDLNSACGTFVNLQKLEGERELADADRLHIGPLVFAVRVGSVSSPPIPSDLQQDGDVLVARPAPEDAAAGALPEEVEQLAAAAFLADDAAPKSAADDTAEIALPTRSTPVVPRATPNSSEAAGAILNEYRRQRKSKSLGNKP